jgi:hypothetical protein
MILFDLADLFLTAKLRLKQQLSDFAFSHTLIMISAYIFTFNVTLYLFSVLIW